MRSLKAASIAIVAMALAGACSSAQAPPSSSALVSSTATPIPATASPPAVASAAASGLVLHLLAVAGSTTSQTPPKWSTKTLSAPADAAFEIAMIVPNPDTHNLWIEDTDHKPLFQGGDQVGSGTKTYQIPALKAGTYLFVCTYHLATMTGTLTVH